jgi:predicted nucleotidyltransferase
MHILPSSCHAGIRWPAASASDAPPISGIAAALRPMFRRAGVHKAIVFGSTARGTSRKRSDVDLMVVMDTAKRFFDRADDLAGIGAVLSGVRFDLLVYTPAEFKTMRTRPFIRRALEEGVTIYGRRERASRG